MFYKNEIFIQGFIKLIEECNEIVLNIYKTDFNVINKEDESPLTLADKKCNDHICDYLKNIKINNSGLISEEIQNDSYDKRKDLEWVWLIDPLDGTKEFVKKNGQFTVNIGLCNYGIPVFGIVSIPVSGEIYYGVKDVGSFKLINNKLIKLQIEQKDLSKDGIKIVASASHLNEETKKYINKFKNPVIVNTGSSIKLLWVAENKADIYPRIAPTSEWDTCAAHAVVKYAGGKVLQYNSKDEVIYNKENLLNPYFIVI